MKKLDDEIATANTLKAEVNAFVTTSRIGFREEKKWQKETVNNLTQIVENIQKVITEENVAVKQQLGSIDKELATIDQSCKGTQVKLQNIDNELNKREHKHRNELQSQSVINEQLRTIIDELKANQLTTESENQALSQTLMDVLKNNEDMRSEIQVLSQTITELQSELTKLKATSLSAITTMISFLHIHSCEKGWTKFDGHCYLIVKESKTWDGALASCREKNSYLIEITTDKEMEFVSDSLLSQYLGGWFFWTGASDRESEGTFLFEYSHRRVPQKYWKEKQPDNYGGNEHCAYLGRIKSGELRLTDNPCKREYYYLCEKP